MFDIHQRIQRIREIETREAGILANLQAVRQEWSEERKMLREVVLGGESTGDRFRDFVIVTSGFPNEKTERVYRDLEARVAQHVGEFVLLIERSEELFVHSGPGYTPQDSDYGLQEHFYLGVLKDGTLSLGFATGRCSFSTSNYVAGNSASARGITIFEGSLGDYWFDQKLNQPLTLRNSFHTEKQFLKLEVKVGDAEVVSWFGEGSTLLENASQLLGRKAGELPGLAA